MSKGVEATAITGVPHEPWVRLADGAELATWGREDEIAYNQANRQTRKLQFFVDTFDFVTDNRVAGDYLEFGCHRGRTFRMALTEARRHNLETMRFYAFDSFEGLPDVAPGSTSVPFWQRGALSTSEAEFRRLVDAHGIYTDRVETIKGFYQDSLTGALRQTLVERGSKVAVANVDCDLYESAVPVFAFLEPLLQEGSVIYLDDYFAGFKGSPRKGVARAFHEYEPRSRFRFVPHLQIGWWGRSFIAYLDE